MAQITKLLLGSIATLSSTELNSLASGSLAISSAAYDNTVGATGDGYTLGQLELVLGALGGAVVANSCIAVWFLSRPDGTNYEDGGSSVQPGRAADAVFPLRVVSTAQRIVLSNVILPPGVFKTLVKNDLTGQTLASSGDTIKFVPYTVEFV